MCIHTLLLIHAKKQHGADVCAEINAAKLAVGIPL